MRDSAEGVSLSFPPSKGQTLAAVLCLAAAAAAWGDISPLLRAPLGFVLMGIIPGWLLARVLLRSDSVTAEETWMAAAVLSIPLSTLARITAGILGISGIAFVVVWALVCAAGSILIPRPRERQGSPDVVAWVIAFVLALAVVFPAMVNPAIRIWGDAQGHAAIVHEILPRALPAEHPAYFGMPLIYAWGFHVWVAALVDAMGVNSFAAFVWINGAMMAALSLGVYRLASLYWPGLLCRRLAPPIVALGMNAIGWLTFVAYSGLVSFTGEVRGTTELREAFNTVLGNPTASSVTMALIDHGPYTVTSQYNLSSFLYKFLCANALSTCLALIVVGFVLASVFVREGGKGRLIALGLVAASAAIIHPVAGVPAAGGYLVGSLLVCLTPSKRLRGLGIAATVALALILAAPVVSFMAGEGLSASEKARIHPSTFNLLTLIQGLFVVAVPGLWGWWELRRRHAELASFGAGFGVVVLVSSLTVDFRDVVELYLVYLAYLAVAFFAAGGVAAAVRAAQKRGHGVLAWVLAGFLFLPSSILLVQGFARDSRGPGFGAYPDTPDEIDVFDYLRDQTPPDAVVVDPQVSHLPPCSSYSHRRAFYGGYYWADMAGYPESEMKRREQAIVNLFFEPDVNDSTSATLNAVNRPVYLVVRRGVPRVSRIRGLPQIRGVPDEPISDAIEKLESFPDLLQPVLRTPTIVLFRWRGGAQVDSEPR